MNPIENLFLKRSNQRSKVRFYYLFVLTFFLFYFSPFLIKGTDVFIDNHDNLDSINLLGIFDGGFKGGLFLSFENPQNTLPGVEQRFTLRHISFEKLLFFLFGFFGGYVINEMIIRIIAFGGMFLLIKIIKGKYQFPTIFQILLALSFASLPFYSQANLSIAGLPMLAVSYFNLFHSVNNIKSLLYIVFFGFYSGFVLVGFFIGILILVLFLYLFINKKLNYWIFSGGTILLFSYFLSHYNLFWNVIFYDTETNRSVTSALFFAKNASAFKQFFEILYNNQYHAVTNHALIILPSIFVLIFENFHRSKRKKLILIFLSFIIFSAFMVGFSYYVPFVKIIGSLGGFTWNRFYWINPLIWYALWAIVLIEMYNTNAINLKFLFSILLISFVYGMKIFPSTMLVFFIVILFLVFFFNQSIHYLRGNNSLVLSSLLIMQILLNTYNYTYRAYIGKPSFKDFFSKEQFEKIILDLDLDKNSIRIGCIGFYPSVANYNGLKTLGAYENIYPLEFKNKFYEIIKDEISKNNLLYNYFTKSGSRLYLYDDEIGEPYYDQQSKIKLHNPEITCDLNTSKMQELGTTHIFSTSKIKNYSEKNLNLLYTSKKESYFYDLYIYKINN